MLIDLRPDHPDSWGRERPLGQWMHSGWGRENPGADENLLSTYKAHAGRWIGPSTVRSFAPLPDGSDVVLRLADYQGVPVIESHLMFDSHDEYKHQPGGGVNFAVGPPKSHYPLWDGIRQHLDLGPVGSVGRTGRPWTIVWAFVAPEPAEDRRTFGWSVHEPGVSKSGPLSISTRYGGLYVGGKLSLTPVDDDGRNLPKSWTKRIADLDPGEMMAMVARFLIDPGGNGFLQVSRVYPDRVEIVAELGNQFGWAYKRGLRDRSGEYLNNQFRLQALKSYNYLRWPLAGRWDDTGIVNWAGPPVKTNRFGRFVVASEGELSYQQAVDIARTQLPGAPAPEPVPVDPGPGVVELREEVAALRAEVDLMRNVAGKRWDTIRAAAEDILGA